jgi:hypothetical protein
MTPQSRSSRRNERGSAYLLVLLLLLVLTVIGLSLAVITQTEVQIGGAERTATRVLYGGDTGTNVQFMLSRFGASQSTRFQLETPSIAGIASEERFDISDFLRIYSGHCNICSSNFGGDDFRRNNFVTNSQGLRVADPTGTNVAQASKLISWMVYVSPEISNRIDESTITFDSAVVADDPAKPGLEVVRY